MYYSSIVVKTATVADEIFAKTGDSVRVTSEFLDKAHNSMFYAIGFLTDAAEFAENGDYPEPDKLRDFDTSLEKANSLRDDLLALSGSLMLVLSQKMNKAMYFYVSNAMSHLFEAKFAIEAYLQEISEFYD